MDNNDKVRKKLSNLFKSFDGNINLMVDFLIENKSFNARFLKKVKESDKLNNGLDPKKIYFKDINELRLIYDRLLYSDNDKISDDKLIRKLEDKIKNLVNLEKYEEAAKIRDKVNKIKNNI